jgi:hypothetical protein
MYAVGAFAEGFHPADGRMVYFPLHPQGKIKRILFHDKSCKSDSAHHDDPRLLRIHSRWAERFYVIHNLPVGPVQIRRPALEMACNFKFPAGMPQILGDKFVPASGAGPERVYFHISKPKAARRRMVPQTRFILFRLAGPRARPSPANGKQTGNANRPEPRFPEPPP